MWLVQETRLELGLHLAGALVVAALGAMVGAGAAVSLLFAAVWSLIAYLGQVLSETAHPPSGNGGSRPAARGRRIPRVLLAAAIQTLTCALLLGPAAVPALLCFTVSYALAVPGPVYGLVRGRMRLIVVGRQGALVHRVNGVAVNGGASPDRPRATAVAEIVRQRAGSQPTAVVALHGPAAHAFWPGEGAEVLDAVSFLERVEGRAPVEMLPDDWHLSPEGFRLTRSLATRLIKRSVDVVLSLVGLAAGLPILVLGGLMVRLSSPGPVFFRQERTGLGGRVFTIRKLRTMVVHDPAKHSRYASERDPRLTWVGALLRRTHLDELPQLVNILVGQMSLVGPRAEWSVLAQEYARVIPWYDLRHAVRPGLTGWAQVCYPYGRSVDDAREKLRYDLYYIKHYTFFLDVVIMARTIRMFLGLR